MRSRITIPAWPLTGIPSQAEAPAAEEAKVQLQDILPSWMALTRGTQHIPACLGVKEGCKLADKHCSPIIVRVLCVLSKVQRPRSGLGAQLRLPLIHRSEAVLDIIPAAPSGFCVISCFACCAPDRGNNLFISVILTHHSIPFYDGMHAQQSLNFADLHLSCQEPLLVGLRELCPGCLRERGPYCQDCCKILVEGAPSIKLPVLVRDRQMVAGLRVLCHPYMYILHHAVK